MIRVLLIRQVAPLLSYRAPSSAPMAKTTSQLPTKSFIPIRKGPSAPTMEAATSKPPKSATMAAARTAARNILIFLYAAKISAPNARRMPITLNAIVIFFTSFPVFVAEIFIAVGIGRGYSSLLFPDESSAGCFRVTL